MDLDRPLSPARLARGGLTLLDRGSRGVAWLVDEALRASRTGMYLTSHLIEGHALPALTFLSTMGEDIATSWSATLRGEQPLSTHLGDLGRRVASGAKCERLVHTLGRELFGSATFAGQETLRRTDLYELNYLPPKAGVARQPRALFHVGGFIPYGDRVFRFLPEANLYDRFLEQGIPVYAMELREHTPRGLRRLTVERLIDTVGELSAVAFAHHGSPLIAEGYCGTGIQLLAYLAARPREADARFDVAALFVAPIDGRKCGTIAELLQHLPRSLVSTKVAAAELRRGYVRGIDLWAGLDTSLKNIFAKTSLGRFAAGWKSPGLAGVRTVADLTAPQRLELAAAYWISIHNAKRCPIPADLIRLFVHLFSDGVTADGDFGVTYRGRRLDLNTIARETGIKVIAFYGGRDTVVQEGSGRVLKEILADRYEHHVHHNAAHVSYIMSPRVWPALSPPPIAALLRPAARRAAA